MAALSIRQQPDNNDNTRGQQHNNGGNRMVAPSLVLPTNDQVDNHHNHYYPPINRSQIEDLRQRLNLKISNASYDNRLTTTPNKLTPTTTDQQQQSTTKKRMLSNRRNSMKVCRLCCTRLSRVSGGTIQQDDRVAPPPEPKHLSVVSPSILLPVSSRLPSETMKNQ
jgi:hypothetical protein